MRMTSALVLCGVLAGAAARAQETPSPALLVLHKGENAMAIVDPASGKVVGRVPTGQDPHELAVSDDGKLAFASNYAGPGPRGGNTLSVIDIAARKELHRVELSPLSRPHGLWFSDGKLYFTAEGSMAIARYDPASNKVDWLLGLGQDRTHMILVSKDQKTIFTSNVSSNTISIIERGGSPQGRPGGPGGFPGGPGGPPGGPGGPPPEPRPGWPSAGRARWSAARWAGWPAGGRGGPVVLRRAAPVEARAGGRRSSRSAGDRRASTSRRTARSSGRRTWATAGSRSSTSPPRRSSQTIDAGARGPNRLKFTPDGKLALVSEIGGGGVIVLDTAHAGREEAGAARSRRQRHPDPARGRSRLCRPHREQRHRRHRPEHARGSGPPQDRLRSRRDGLAAGEAKLRRPAGEVPRQQSASAAFDSGLSGVRDSRPSSA